METASIKKSLTIELDVVTGVVDVNNSDEMLYGEIVSLLEYAKMMIMKDWLEN